MDKEPKLSKMDGFSWKCPKCNKHFKSLWLRMITENIKAHVEAHHANETS